MAMKIDTSEWHKAQAGAKPLAIEARGLVKRFDGFTAVDGVDLTVPEGAIYGVLGPNGAGKTTTLRMLLGIIDSDEGHRRILGADRPHDVAHLIGYLPEERGLYPAMKAYEAIAFIGALRGLPMEVGRQRGRELLEEHGLGYAADRQIRQLSKGMAQQVQLLGTLVHEPRLVVFEPMPSGCATKWRSLQAARCPSPARWTSPATASARRCGWKPGSRTGHGALRCRPMPGTRGPSGTSRCPRPASSRCCAR